MAFSSGTFSRLFDWTTDRDSGIRIRADRFDQELDGFATGLSTTILKDGTQTTTAVVPFAFGISIVDNKAITLGTNSDITIQYDETTNDSLEIAAAVEGAALGIVLKSDQGDDNADQHKLSIADGGTLTLASKISGSFVTYLTHTPNSTVASSTLAVAGNLTVGGNLTLGSGAELSEAELEMLDGITAGTVAASKAVVVDANKDAASFRNITLTGELDAGSLDVSGDADIDGTLEADAMTLNGSAITTTETLSIGISNGNVLVATSGIADNDFLKVDGTSIEGRSASEVLSDIGAAPAAGDSNIVTTGALNSGSITSGFGAIDNGSSNITTTGVGTFGSLDISGDIDVDGTTNLDVVDIDGAVDMASTLTVAGAFTSVGIDDNADANAITIDSSERILIGTTAAETLAPSTTPKVQIEGTDHHTSSLSIVRNSNDNGQSLLILGKSRGTSVGADTVVQDDDNVGEILFTAADGSDRTPQVASVRAAVDGTPGSNDMPGRLEFYTTADGSQTITKRMTINSSGLVTIQNDSDTDYNTNQTASNTVLNLKNTTSGASNSVGLSFSTEANGEQYITAVQVSDNSRSDLTFGARNGGSRSETMRIAGDGHLLLNMQTALQSAYLSIEGQGRTRCISLDADSSSGGLIGFFFGDSAVGNINTNGSVTNYVTSSDYRLKENINYSFDATTELKKLKPAKFNFKRDKDTTVMGFLAHEVSSIVPEAISGIKDETQDLGTIRDKDGNIEQENALEIHAKKDEGQTWTKTKTEDVYQGIDQSKIVPLLVKTIQELEARVTALESA